MNKQDYEKVKEITECQEKMLVFEHFTNKDAWELGSFITKMIYDQNIALSVAIRKLNGAILYQHMTDGTNLNNQNWMMRKFRTVSLMERSSLGAWAISNLTGETASVHGLDDLEYVFCGGGFPIRLKTGELAAVITVSNLPHLEDHQFIADALSKWLGVENVPRVLSEE